MKWLPYWRSVNIKKQNRSRSADSSSFNEAKHPLRMSPNFDGKLLIIKVIIPFEKIILIYNLLKKNKEAEKGKIAETKIVYTIDEIIFRNDVIRENSWS